MGTLSGFFALLPLNLFKQLNPLPKAEYRVIPTVFQFDHQAFV
jgi:hypothetical protein